MKKTEIRSKNIRRALNAIEASFLKRGITATTKDLVARETDLSLSSIVRYYRKKSSMATAVFDDIEPQFALEYAEISEMIKEGKKTGAEMLKAFAKRTVESFFNNSKIHLLKVEVEYYMFRTKVGNTLLMKPRLEETVVYKLLKAIIEKGKEDNTIIVRRDCSTETNYIINTISGSMVNLKQYSNLYKEKDNTIGREMLARTFALLIFGFTAKENEKGREQLKCILSEILN